MCPWPLTFTNACIPSTFWACLYTYIYIHISTNFQSTTLLAKMPYLQIIGIMKNHLKNLVWNLAQKKLYLFLYWHVQSHLYVTSIVSWLSFWQYNIAYSQISMPIFLYKSTKLFFCKKTSKICTEHWMNSLSCIVFIPSSTAADKIRTMLDAERNSIFHNTYAHFTMY